MRAHAPSPAATSLPASPPGAPSGHRRTLSTSASADPPPPPPSDLFSFATDWAEIWLPASDSSASGWTFVNVPPESKEPDAGLCGDDFDPKHGCGYNASAPKGDECEGVSGGPGAAMQDHEIFAVTWSSPDEEEGTGSSGTARDRVRPDEGGEVLSVAGRTLSDGVTPATPLVWAPSLTSPLGEPLRNVGLRVVNRTGFYRCKPRHA